jgi:hypothetical protein
VPDKDGDLDIQALGNVQIIRVLDTPVPLDEGQSYTTVSHWYNRQDLFAHRPCIEDVEQQRVGDCFLLAGLHAIIHTNPDLIYGMMRDRREGWVVVRLYAGAGQEVYYEVEKTYVTSGGWRQRSLQGHKAWWVYMLEKAYAIHRQQAGGHTFKPKNDDERLARTYVELLTGGHTHDALQTLLGGSKRMLGLQPEGKLSGAFANLELIVGNRDPNPSPNSPTGQAFEEVFGGFSSEAAEQFAYYRTPKRMMDFTTEFRLEDRTVIRQETLLAFFKQNYRFSYFVREWLESYICRHFPGKRGTGVYTLEQRRLYEKIEEMLAARHFVVVGSGKNLGKARGQVGQTGEGKVKGLAGPHGYQVVGVREAGSYGQLKFLCLRNPWLRYAREYNWKDKVVQGERVRVLTAAEVDRAPRLHALDLERRYALGAGEFLLELSDLTKRFTQVYFASGKDRELPGLGELEDLVA